MNAIKHSAYKTISSEMMFYEEIEYANSVFIDIVETLEEQLRILNSILDDDL